MDNSGPIVAIVDDDEIVRRSLGRLLASLTCRPVEFESGERFVAGLPGARPDCVLLDLHMPGMDGFSVLRRVRETCPALRVIVITALDQPGVCETCLAAGAADYLVKPLERDVLGRAIGSALHG